MCLVAVNGHKPWQTDPWQTDGLFSAPSGWGKGPDCRLQLCTEQQYLPLLKSMGGLLERDCRLLGDFNTHVGNYTETWRGLIENNGLPDLNLSGVLLLILTAF